MYLVRVNYFLGGATYQTKNEVFKTYSDAQKAFLKYKDEILQEADFNDFVGDEWTTQNIEDLDKALQDEYFGCAGKEYVEVDGSSVSLEETSNKEERYND